MKVWQVFSSLTHNTRARALCVLKHLLHLEKLHLEKRGPISPILFSDPQGETRQGLHGPSGDDARDGVALVLGGLAPGLTHFAADGLKEWSQCGRI